MMSAILKLCQSTFVALTALAVAENAALAQPADPGASTVVPPLTVQGAAEPKVIQKQTWSFVEAYAAPAPKLGLIARWREPICVQVVNLTPEQTAMVQARIEQVARGVGLPVRKPGCRSNIQIVLTSQPQAFIDKVAKGDEHALGFHYPSELKTVKTVSHPIQAWYKTATQSAKFQLDGLEWDLRDHDGHPVLPEAAFPIAQSGESVDIPDNPLPPGCAGSLISDCTRSVFKNVLVVVDSHAVAGKDLGAVADYVAMLALSQVKLAGGCSPMPSILDLLAQSRCAGRDAPSELTAADASYLTALYASAPEVRADIERVEMARRMAEMLIKAKVAGH